MPYDFFLNRYNEAYVTETIAFCKSLTDETPVPCTGADGLTALIMAMAADKSAAENRWVKMAEIIDDIRCGKKMKDISESEASEEVAESDGKKMVSSEGVLSVIKPMFQCN